MTELSAPKIVAEPAVGVEPSVKDEPKILSSDSFGIDPSADPFFRAMRWAEVSRDAPEYRPFFKWLDENKDDKRADMKERLRDQIQEEWDPDEIPEPIRKWIFASMKTS